MNFFDMFGSFPTAQRLAFDIRSFGQVEGYNDMFGRRLAKILAVPADVITAVAALPEQDYARRAVDLLAPHTRSGADLVADLKSQGSPGRSCTTPCPPGCTTRTTSWPSSSRRTRTTSSGSAGSGPSRRTRRRRRSAGCAGLGLRGVTMTPFWHRARANDTGLDPICEACVETGVPIWIHTSMFWDGGAPLSFEHPLYLDEVATRHPDLRIIAGHGGWPWMADMVAVAWRQPNVYVDVSAFRPRHVATPGSGWDMLWYQLPRLLSTKVILGNTWQLLGMPVADVLADVDGLGLDDRVAHRWKYANLAGVLGMEDPS